jgi:hypothetical protein
MIRLGVSDSENAGERPMTNVRRGSFVAGLLHFVAPVERLALFVLVT